MADAALVASALLMGLAGGPHCAAMCGAAQAGLTARGGTRAATSLQLGRLAGYAAAGALVAASVSGLSIWSAVAPAWRPVWTLLQVAAIAVGGWLLWRGRAPRWLARVGARPAAAGTQPLRFFARMPASMSAAAAGACWAAMPCGLLQSALVVAALASGPAAGAGVMAVFALGSAASLALVPVLWARLAHRDVSNAAPALALRVAGALMLGSAVAALSHGLIAELDRALC